MQGNRGWARREVGPLVRLGLSKLSHLRVKPHARADKFLRLPSCPAVNTLCLQAMKTPSSTLCLATLTMLLAVTFVRGQTIQLLKDVNTTPPAASSHVESMLLAGGRIYISADDPVSGAELWSMAIPSSFNTPSATAVDAEGNVYVLDTPNHTIRRISASGLVTTLAGRPGVAGGENGAGINATFRSPEGIAVDGNGNIYVADTGNHAIRRINSLGIVTTVVGSIGNQGTTNGTGANTRLRSPRGVAINAAGSVMFIADSGNHTLRRVTLTTTPATPALAETVTANVSLMAGSAQVSGSDNGTGSGAKFNNPTSIVMDNSRTAYVTDTGNHTIRRVTEGGTVTTLAGTAGSTGSQNGTAAAALFNSPRGIAVEPSGSNIYVADTANHLIRRITTAGVVTTLAGLAGVAGSVEGTGIAANFSSPRGIAFRGNLLYVGDTQNHVVRTVSTTAGLTALFAGRVAAQGAADGASVVTGSVAPAMLKDILPGSLGSAPAKLTVVGNRLFFTAIDATGQRDLWVTDGTPTGTNRVTTSAFYPAPPGEPDQLTNVNGTLFFQGYSSSQGLELWKATVAGNGTVTAELVKDINTEEGQGSSTMNYFSTGTSLLFAAFDGNDPDGDPLTPPRGFELWKSNGTTAGTALLADLFPGSTDSLPRDFVSFGGFTYFSADGQTSAPPVEAIGRELFRLDNSLSNPALVADIATGGSGSEPRDFVVSGGNSANGGRLYFTASTLNQGRELWVLDEQTGLTSPTLVTDLFNGVTDSGVSNLTPYLDPESDPNRPQKVLFTADNNNNIGTELFASDGTSIGTRLVSDLESGPDSSVLSNFIQTSPGWVIFTKESVDGTLTLYSTNGSDVNVVEDFLTETTGTPSQDAKRFRSPVKLGTQVLFLLGADELWITDGLSDAGTYLVHRFRSGSQGSEARDFTRMSDGRTVFTAVTEAAGRELWITGVDGVTSALPQVVAGELDGDPQNLTATTDGRVFFTAADADSNRELWVTDGIAITKVKEINSSAGSDPNHLFWHQPSTGSGRLYFSAADQSGDQELWISDGTSVGTVLVLDINTGIPPSNPGSFGALGNTVYFAASRATDGRELWKTQGTEATTSRVLDFNTGAGSSDPEDLVVMNVPGVGQRLFFSVFGFAPTNLRRNTGRELWMTDGTDPGTSVVKDIILLSTSSLEAGNAWVTLSNNRIFFVADDAKTGKELWMSTGVSGNATLVKDIRTNSVGIGLTQGSEPTHLVNANGRIFFLADDGVNGRELWTSTGTSASTVLVRNIAAGSASPGIQDLIAVGDIVCFTADDGVSGREVWVSDGSSAGTFMLEDMLPGDRTSSPSSLAGFGTNLYLSAADSQYGQEPRIAELPAKIALEQPLGTYLTESGVHTVNFTPSSPLSFAAPGVTLPIRISNAGISPLRNLAATLSGRHSGDFKIVSSKLPTSITAAEPFLLQVQFLPKEGGTREAVLTILSSDQETPQFVINLSGVCSKDPTVTTHPSSLAVKVGQPVSFNAAASGTSPLAIQWRRNNAPISGATTSPLYLWSAQLKDAGNYTALFSNSVRPGGTAVTDAAQLLVVEDFNPVPRVIVSRVGATVSLTVNAAGTITNYDWQFSQGALSNATGANTRTLTLRNVQATQSGTYSCRVSGPAGTVVGGTTELRIFTTAPVINAAQNMPIGVVGAFYRYQMVVSADVANTATTYTATALPPGLRIDAKTGLISGRPTRAGNYTISLGASNGLRPDPERVTAQLQILEMPSGLDGIYTGIVERQSDINADAGGRFDLTVTKTGSFSGALLLGAERLPVSGNLEFAVDAVAVPPVAKAPYNATVVLMRRGIATPLTLRFEIKPDTKDRLINASLTTPTATGTVSAALNGWKAGAVISPYVGLYNFGIRLPISINGSPNQNRSLPQSAFVPQGTGFGSFTIAARGTLSIAGQTADGERITCATFIGPDGEVLLYQSLYTTTRKGSIQGVLKIDKGVDGDFEDNVIATSNLADMDWVRPPATAVLSSAAATRTYRAGFGLRSLTPSVTAAVALEAFGGLYQAPSVILKVVAPSDTSDNASLSFAEANVPSPRVDVPLIAINARNVIKKLPTSPTTTINGTVRTGVFSGNFVLEDDDVTTSRVNAKEVRRSVNFQGLIVPEGAEHRGVGYFMLPQIPSLSTELPATSQPVLSGVVVFDHDTP
jgi:ELWxxDGT repeat protein